MGEVRIREAARDDALVVAALTLQCAIQRGGSGDPGFLDRFANAWAHQVGSRPVWLAEASNDHAGHLQATRVDALPWPGLDRGGRLVVDTFFVRPAHRGIGVGELLLRAAVEFARREGFGAVVLDAGPKTRPMVERIGFVRDDSHYRMTL